MKYIVLDKLIYALEDEIYIQLSDLADDLKSAKEIAENDEWEYVDEYNNLNNFLDWVRVNLKPVSSEEDNYDLHRYECKREHVKDSGDYPF